MSNQAGDGIPSPWEHPGKVPLWKGSAHPQFLWLLPGVVVQRVTTLEPSRR